MFEGKNLYAIVWLTFFVLLMQGIREKNKTKIIIASILIVLPLIILGWLIFSIV